MQDGIRQCNARIDRALADLESAILVNPALYNSPLPPEFFDGWQYRNFMNLHTGLTPPVTWGDWYRMYMPVALDDCLADFLTHGESLVDDGWLVSEPPSPFPILWRGNCSNSRCLEFVIGADENGNPLDEIPDGIDLEECLEEAGIFDYDGSPFR